MSDFFSKKLSSSETDLAIVRGVIAEYEGKNTAEVKVVVETTAETAGAASDDLESLFG